MPGGCEVNRVLTDALIPVLRTQEGVKDVARGGSGPPARNLQMPKA